MPTHSRTAGTHQPIAPRPRRAERRNGPLRALLAGCAAMPAYPALCWWFPFAARMASSRTREP